MLLFPTGQKKLKYRGQVKYVNGNTVFLRVNERWDDVKIVIFKKNNSVGPEDSLSYQCLDNSLYRYDEQIFDVVFTDNTRNMTCQREAVEFTHGLGDVLFPLLPINCAQEITVPDLRSGMQVHFIFQPANTNSHNRIMAVAL